MPSFHYLTVRPLHAHSVSASIDAVDDWEQLGARVAATLSDAEIRGLFISELAKTLGKDAPSKHYIAFRHYPMREYLELLLRVARVKHPGMTACNAVLRVGLNVFETFANSLAGQAIFGIAQLDYRRHVELAPKAYEVTLRPGRVQVVSISDSSAVVQFRDVWALPDVFHAGVWLGGMRVCGVRGSIEIKRHSLCDVDFTLEWR